MFDRIVHDGYFTLANFRFHFRSKKTEKTKTGGGPASKKIFGWNKSLFSAFNKMATSLPNVPPAPRLVSSCTRHIPPQPAPATLPHPPDSVSVAVTAPVAKPETATPAVAAGSALERLAMDLGLALPEPPSFDPVIEKLQECPSISHQNAADEVEMALAHFRRDMEVTEIPCSEPQLANVIQ